MNVYAERGSEMIICAMGVHHAGVAVKGLKSLVSGFLASLISV